MICINTRIQGQGKRKEQSNEKKERERSGKRKRNKRMYQNYKWKRCAVPFGSVKTSFGKSLKYTCLIASMAEILFFGTH